MTTFFVAGIPAAQGSKNGYVRGGRAVLVESSKKLIPWRNEVARIAFQRCAQPLDGPVYVRLEFLMPRPKAWGKKRQDPMVQKPDGDKLTRAVFDALTGIAYRDDSQVTTHYVHKRRARHEEDPGVYITVKEDLDD